MFTSLTDPAAAHCLNTGGVIVAPTDTLYGILARASDRQAVERVYKLRHRAPEKPCIVLVAGHWQITDTSLWTPQHYKLADTYWPGPLSLVAPTAHTDEYLHRGTHTLAYRVPDKQDLQTLLGATGMLIAPSANPESQPPAKTVAEAYAYFGESVDGYIDGGTLDGGTPSTLVTLQHGKLEVLRPGAVHIS